MRSRLAFHENGVSLTPGRVGLGEFFLFCAEFSGLTPPGSTHPLYTPTALTWCWSIHAAIHDPAQDHAKKRDKKRPKIDHIQPIYGVINRIGQGMSDLHISCILGHTQRNLIIYRFLRISRFHRLRITWLLRSLRAIYPHFIHSYLYYYYVLLQDFNFFLHAIWLWDIVIYNKIIQSFYLLPILCAMYKPNL